MLREYPRGLENSGKVSEYFLLSKVKTGDPAYEKEARACLSIQNPEAQWVCAVRLIRAHQPFDPKNPKKKFLRDWLEATAEFLDEKERDRLEMLTAVDSMVDFKFHADALVLLRDGSANRFMIAKADATEHPKTIEDPESSKADILISYVPDPLERPNDYKDKLHDLGKETAKVLKTKAPIEL